MDLLIRLAATNHWRYGRFIPFVWTSSKDGKKLFQDAIRSQNQWMDSIETINIVGLSPAALEQTCQWPDANGIELTTSVRELLEE